MQRNDFMWMTLPSLKAEYESCLTDADLPCRCNVTGGCKLDGRSASTGQTTALPSGPLPCTKSTSSSSSLPWYTLAWAYSSSLPRACESTSGRSGEIRRMPMSACESPFSRKLAFVLSKQSCLQHSHFTVASFGNFVRSSKGETVLLARAKAR